MLPPSKLPRKLTSPALPALPLDTAITTAGATATPTAAKKVHQFRNVDFDNRIQEDVHRLASSSSSSSLRNSGNSSNSSGHGKGTSGASTAGAGAAGEHRRYVVQATDPKVLEAPIIVPEDMSLIREQYIQAQINELVLPPMERKA
jgi:hypothetical protein